jgi:hypothetical protein
MKSVKSIKLIVLVALSPISLFFSGCENSGDTSHKPGFYLLSKDIDFFGAKEMKIENLPLRAEPWIGLDDIEMYDQSGGCLYFTHEMERPVKKSTCEAPRS